MAALPPSRHERRARPGSLASPVNSRMYRGTWLLVGIPLLVAAFTVYRPDPLRGRDLEPQFDGAAARADRPGVREQQFPVRTSRALRGAAHDATNWVARAAARVRPRTPKSTVFTRKSPAGASVELENVHRDPRRAVEPDHRGRCAPRQPGASPGANDNGSGTAALIELARSFATPHASLRSHSRRTTRSSSCPRDGGAFGGLGAEHFAAQYRSATGSSRRSTWTRSRGRGPPHLVFGGDTPRFASAELVRTLPQRILEQAGVEPTTTRCDSPSSSTSAFPLSLYEQAPFVDRGIAAITITSRRRPAPAVLRQTRRRTSSRRRLTATRAARARPCSSSLDDEVELAEGTSSYVYLGERVVRGWAVVLVLVRGHAAVPRGDRRPLRPASPATHPARARTSQLPQPACVLALRRAALRAVRPSRGLGDGRGQAARAGAFARERSGRPSAWPSTERCSPAAGSSGATGCCRAGPSPTPRSSRARSAPCSPSRCSRCSSSR